MSGRPLDEAAQEAIEDLEVQIAEDDAKEEEVQQGEFSETADGYRLRRPGIEVEVAYLKRSHAALRGEVLVRTWIPGARSRPGDILAVETLNLTSARTRKGFASYLAERSRLEKYDWTGLLEHFCQQVLAAERRGAPAVFLNELPEPTPDETLDVLGWPLLERHPVILFGDGGSCKSYLALYVAGMLSRSGKRPGIFDWELDSSEHRRRLGRLFGDNLPRLAYARCSQPLTYEADRLRRIVHENRLDYVVLDSIGFACDGPPESAEAAGKFFQALRSLGTGVGSLLLAHVSRALEGADRRPFGSAFWHNGARSTWNVKLAEGSPDSSVAAVAFHHRKANLGPLRSSLGFELAFYSERTTVRRIDLADSPDLAAGLSIRQRMAMALRKGPLPPDVLAEEIEAKPDTIRRIGRRYPQQFTLIQGGKLSLAERRFE